MTRSLSVRSGAVRASASRGEGVAVALTRLLRRGRRLDRGRSRGARSCRYRRRAEQASTTPSRRSRGASGIVTSTASGASRPITQPISSRPPTTWTPWMRRRRRRGSSSTNPTTRSPGVSRSSRSRLRPLRPAPTISSRCWRRARRASREPAGDRALPEARGADEERAEEHVDEVRPAREAVPRHRRPDEEERGGLGDHDAATMLAASRAPA